MTKDELKEEMQYKMDVAKGWCERNKDTLLTLAPYAITLGIELIKIASKRGCICEERKLKNNYIYDRENGHFYELKRKPKSSEWLQIDHMRELGDLSLGIILRDMGLLK